MFINADFSRRAIVTPAQHHWVPSPLPGVERMMLDRLGGEKSRATSLVRYMPGAGYTPHQHPGGEEILVLSGTFSEGVEDHPVGCYLRNPPGSNHQPFTREGAVIFVKLWQMFPSEGARVRIETSDPARWQRKGERAICPLFSGNGEQVVLQRLASGEQLFSEPVGGAEFLVLAGGLMVGNQSCEKDSWARLPVGEHPDVTAGPLGATIYLKTGHLANRI